MVTRATCVAYNAQKADCATNKRYKPIKPWRKPMKTLCARSCVALCGGKVLKLSEM